MQPDGQPALPGAVCSMSLGLVLSATTSADNLGRNNKVAWNIPDEHFIAIATSPIRNSDWMPSGIY
jgi:hypothetical protein